MGKFKFVIDKAVRKGDIDTIKDLYSIQSDVNSNLEILYTEDSPLLEEIVRILTRVDLKYKVLNNEFTLLDYPLYNRKDFVKLFAYLESVDEGGKYKINREFNNLLTHLKGIVPDKENFYEGWKCHYNKVIVVYKYTSGTTITKA